MQELEQEILDPSGISTVGPPKMILNGILISKSCGILYHIDESTGLRYVASLRWHCNIPNKTLAHGATVATPLTVRHCPPRYSVFRSKQRS